jgi:hypothetical protein
VVKITLTDVLDLELTGADLWAGGILFGLELALENSEYQIRLDPTLGIGGQIRCKGLRFEVDPEETAPV